MSTVVDEISRKSIPIENSVYVLWKIVGNIRQFGYISKKTPGIIQVVYKTEKGSENTDCAYYPNLKDHLIYSKYRGYYLLKEDYSDRELLYETFSLGYGEFPYHFARMYEAIEHFDLFKDKQEILEKKEYTLAKYLPYTFGLEFETSQGYIPEEICFRDGLIPLRDGSIQGLEYSTVVLDGNTGLSLLEQQLNTLREYTTFNQDCSLHIHLGGFPLKEDCIFRLYKLCTLLESDLGNFVPYLTFRSNEYKSTGKNYCKPLKLFNSFEALYQGLVGRDFFGSFSQAHPDDIDRKRKWQVSSRYFWLNLVNLICYRVNKTVEFRFLRPTYNFQKIKLWLYIFNAILQYAENLTLMTSYIAGITLEIILNKIYPPKLAEKLTEGLARLQILRNIQSRNKDDIGNDLSREDILFPNTLNF